MTDIANNNAMVAIYVRTSTVGQKDEQTIESQIAELKTVIESEGNILPEENVFCDDGFTGELLARPGLDAMLESARKGSFSALYVYDRGRLSRVFAYQEIIIEEILDLDIRFITLHDVKAETPEERVLQAMQGVFHQYERVKISERMRRGKLYKTRAGVLINGNSVYGYNYIKKTTTIPAHYVINEEESRVVRLIFQWFVVERLSLREVIKKLYDLDIKPRKRKSPFWTKGPLVRLLKCDAYANGLVYYNKSQAVIAKNPTKNEKYRRIKRSSRVVRPKEDWIPFAVPPLLEDKNLFDKAQIMLENNRRFAIKNRKHEYLLSGLVYCECGSRRAGDGYSKGDNHYYRCAQRIYKYPMPSQCKSPGVNAVILDRVFWEKLVAVLSNPELIKNYAQLWMKSQSILSSADKVELNKLQSLVVKIKQEEERYVKAYGDGLLEFEQFKDFISDVKKRRSSVEVQIAELNEKAKACTINGFTLDELCEEAKIVLDSLDLSNQAKVIKELVKKVIITGFEEVEAWVSIPLSTLNMSYEPIYRNRRTSERRKINII